MANPILFHTSGTQTSTANQELIQPNKPEGYNGAFIPNYFNFYNVEDCHVLLNSNPTEMEIPAGGFEFGSVYQLQTLKIVEAGIHFNFSGACPPSIVPTQQPSSNQYKIMAEPSQITLSSGQAQQIIVTAVHPALYNPVVQPQGTTYTSNNTAVCSVDNNTGMVSYVGSGYTTILVENNGFSDIINVTCI